MTDISTEGQAALTKIARLYRELNGTDPKTDGEPE